jgi:prolyl-tRNA synthetase
MSAEEWHQTVAETAATKLKAELEERRRATQRDIQKKVAELRAYGSSASAIKAAVNRIKRVEQEKVIRIQTRSSRAELGMKHQVVIIPVEWRRHEAETSVIDEVAGAVKQALMSTGLDAWLDGRRQYTPGQKFAYWEHLGVKHRIEIGPEDLKNFTCRVVRADKPGAYLEHQRLPSVPLNARSIVEALDSFGLKVQVDINMISDEPILKLKSKKVENVSEEAADWVGNVALSEESVATKKMKCFGSKRRNLNPNRSSRPY